MCGYVGSPFCLKHHFRMLIDGAPGVGKTTLCRKFCKDWGAGQILKQFSIVWLLNLREERIAKAKSLDDLFQHCSARDTDMCVCLCACLPVGIATHSQFMQMCNSNNNCFPESTSYIQHVSQCCVCVCVLTCIASI